MEGRPAGAERAATELPDEGGARTGSATDGRPLAVRPTSLLHRLTATLPEGGEMDTVVILWLATLSTLLLLILVATVLEVVRPSDKGRLGPGGDSRPFPCDPGVCRFGTSDWSGPVLAAGSTGAGNGLFRLPRNSGRR